MFINRLNTETVACGMKYVFVCFSLERRVCAQLSEARKKDPVHSFPWGEYPHHFLK